MISVITPTVRPEGLKLVEKALMRQTYTDFEWLICAPKKLTGLVDENTTMEYTFVQEPVKQTGDVWSLNKAYNKLISVAKGQLIVSWQDFTYAKPDTLEKFWFHFTKEPKTLVTAVGNKYEDDTWKVMTWKDPRERDDQGTYYQCYSSDIEWNLASVPKEAILAVGGFDVSLDKKYGMDAYSVNDRIDLIGGYDFKIDQTIKSYSLEHGRLNGKEWDKNNWLPIYNDVHKRYIEYPVLDYLK